VTACRQIVQVPTCAKTRSFTGGWTSWVSRGAPPSGFVGDPVVVDRTNGACTIYVEGADHAVWQQALDAWRKQSPERFLVPQTPVVGPPASTVNRPGFPEDSVT